MWYRGPSLFWGGFLVIIGVLFLLANTGVLQNIEWNYIWPVFLIALGLWLILARIGPGGADVDTADSRDGLDKAKLDNKTFLVKASGSNLETLRERHVVECRSAALLALLDQKNLSDAGGRRPFGIARG